MTVDGHGEVEILATEVEIEEFALDGFALAEDAGLKVALDTRLTAPLEREGMVRELVHRLQNLRKEQGLAITDRVSVRLGMGGVLAEAVAEHRAYREGRVARRGVRNRTSRRARRSPGTWRERRSRCDWKG